VTRLDRAEEIEADLLHQMLSVVTEVFRRHDGQNVLTRESSNTDLGGLISIGRPVFAVQTDDGDMVCEVIGDVRYVLDARPSDTMQPYF
jgi:hypothetical protein